MFKSFIETQFPVSKVSKESYKERKAVQSQTLTGLGKWWGRKPLILVRATILGLLMPASADPVRDREIFLKILTMDEEGLWLRKSKNIPVKEIYQRITPKEREQWLDPESPPDKPKIKRGTSPEDKETLQRLVFHRLSYDEKLAYCDRPEHVDGPSQKAWVEINKYLGTTSKNLTELVRQLGERQFGRVPRVGDAFCGGGSVPFEAARMGCDTYGSDLNPVATLMAWAALNIVGGGKDVAKEVQQVQREVYEAVDQQVTDWKIEHNELGWRADAYLYCNEIICPECNWKVPLLSTLLIGPTSVCIAKLIPNEFEKNYDICIESNTTKLELKQAEKTFTIKNSSLVCPNCNQVTPIAMIRGDRRDDNNAIYGLRLWERDDFVAGHMDLFHERLYCIRWVITYNDDRGRKKTKRHFLSPNEYDINRERKVIGLLHQTWKENGYLPTRSIELGYETRRLMRERGWTHWHHLFTPRQLLYISLLLKEIENKDTSLRNKVACLLGIGRVADWNSKLCRWGVGEARESIAQTFYNQALNTLFTFAGKGFLLAEGNWFLTITTSNNNITNGDSLILPMDARNINNYCEFWITDPPYADAINYHELSEFFLAWYEKHLIRLFPNWYTDSKRALAITGTDESFLNSMIDCYKSLAEHMPANGVQIVMFTHQDTGVWADLALILWSAGLRVTAAWCIATETDSALREGNYVQGTVLLVLRKQTCEETAFFDEIYPLVEEEVKKQLNDMLALDDKENPNFGDTDYQLAAYAAALRVLTRYRNIEDIDVARELSRTRQKGEQSPVVKVINQAVRIACDHLVPQGLDTFTWKGLAPEERFYLKGLDMESRGEYRAGAYQELARGFGLREYKPLMAGTKANQTRVKTAGEFGTRQLGDTGFGATLVRQVLFAVRESVRTGETVTGRNWFRNELQGTYWDQRQTIIKILYYLASLGANKNMPHWYEDANAARLLAGAVENDHV